MNDEMPEIFENEPEPKSDAYFTITTKGVFGGVEVRVIGVDQWEEGLDYRAVMVIEDGTAMLRLKDKDAYIPLSEIKMVEINRPTAGYLERWEAWFKASHGGMTHEEYHIMRRQGAVDNKVAALVEMGAIDEDMAGSIIGAVHEIIGDYLASTHAH